jgi:RNA polymerase sigma-70 factor (family 1)
LIFPFEFTLHSVSLCTVFANTTYEEKDLLRRVAGGDEPAFRLLFHHYNRLLRPFVVKLTRSDLAAEEVLQEVFLKIWLYREKLARVDNPKAYIVRIVSNESLNYLRTQAKNNRLFEEIRQISPPEYSSPEQALTYRETEKLIQEAIQQLPRGCRQVYQLSRDENKRIPEIASALKLSDSTVKNQLVKALKIIRLHIARTIPLLIACLLSKF